ncbi:hypothetical protein EDD15DRAFT_2222662 [Pisolithus albus]|nr:hypothetical protein EDD15DRAFT_2222662 [Pisolithus albus]
MLSPSSSLSTSELSANELLQHLDCRQVAAFFVGWVFTLSIVCIISSSSTAYIKQGMSSFLLLRLSRLFRVLNYWVEDAVWRPKTSLPEARSLRGGVTSIAIFTLYISFASACLAKFVSLSTFTTPSGPFACAFSISWSGISSICGRLLGLLSLCHEIRKWGVNWIEMYTLYVGMTTVLVLAFVEYTIGTGAAELVPESDTYLCYEIRYLPISIARSVVHIILGFHILVRLLFLAAPTFLAFRHRIGAIADTKAIRAVSLLTCELLFIVPSVRFIGTVGDSLIFTAGSLLVLVSFYKDSSASDDVNNLATLSPVGITISRASALLPTPPSIRFIGPFTSRPHTVIGMDSLSNSVTILSATPTIPARTIQSHAPLYEPGRSFAGQITRAVDRGQAGLCSMDLERCGDRDEHSDQEKQKRDHPEELSGSSGPRCVDPFAKNSGSLAHNGGHIRMAGGIMDEGQVQRRSRAEYSTVEHTSAIETATSQQSWLSLLNPIASAERPLLLPDTGDPWLTFGGCSLSPTRRQRFSDQSLLVSRWIKSTDVPEAQLPSLRLARWQTVEDRLPSARSSERRPGGETEVEGFVQGGPNFRITRTCLRGPRPQPKAVLSTTPRTWQVVSDS